MPTYKVIIEKPNKSVINLLKKISECDAIEATIAKDGTWKRKLFTQSGAFSDMKIWIKNNILFLEN